MSQPAPPIPNEVTYTVRIFPDNRGQSTVQFWVEVGPAGSNGQVWDAGAMSLDECLEWAANLIEELARDRFGQN